jgi:glycosyltransferase involved in cell wall biosynthesis
MIAEGFPGARLQVLHNGVDASPAASPLERGAARIVLGVPDEAFVVGTIARLDPVKDLATAIEALVHARTVIPGLVLAVVGDGEERVRLQGTAQRLGVADAVRFVGSRSDARRLLSGFDLYVNSSISEGISLTILEAMAAGVPVIATSVGGTPEIVSDGHSGLLVAARNAPALGAAIRTLALQPDKRKQIGIEGRRTVEERFTIDRMIDHYAQLYRGLVGATP